MAERKHGVRSSESNAVQPMRDEDQQPGKHPADALSSLTANTAQPTDILTLQNAVGNRSVRRLIKKQSQPRGGQRHVPPAADEAFYSNAVAGKDNWIKLGTKIKAAKQNATEAVEIGNQQIVHDNAIIKAFNAAKSYPAQSGGEAQSPQSGGESQSPSGGEDIDEGAGESQSPQGGEDIYEGG